MRSVNPEFEPSLFATVDFRAFFETVRLRWWVIPAVVAASFAFLQAQESDLRTAPASYVVSRGYEVGSPFTPFAVLGINVAETEFPDPMTQLLILKSNETRREIAEQLGKDIEVKLPENWEMPVTFVCNQPVKIDCERAIEAYVAKARELRREAVLTGVKNLRAVLVDLQTKKPDQVTADRILALDLLSDGVDIPFALVDGFEQEIGPTVNDVRRPTLLMGVAGGLFISLLILLQLTFSDKRVRSARQLVRLVGAESFLGAASRKADSVRDRRVALGLREGFDTTSEVRFRCLPLRKEISDSASLTRLSELSRTTLRIEKPFTELGVGEIAKHPDDESDVLIVQRNRDLRSDVVEALTALQRTNRRVVGVLLLN